MDIKNKRLLLIVSVLSLVGIISIIWYSLFMGNAGSPMPNHGFCPRMIPNYLLWLSMILVVIAVVPISYYFISKKLEEKMEKNLKAISKLVDNKLNTNGDKIQTNGNSNLLRLLNPNEKKVIQSMMERDGSILQSELSRMEGMTKLKVHRAVKELQNKGIVKLEQYGKTNKIILSDDIKEII